METVPMKIAMLGESSVGKTCIINRFVLDQFDAISDSTKGAHFKTKSVFTSNGKREIKLMIWDTAGQEIYRSLAPFYFKDADAAILVYDITNYKSYEAIDYWMKEVQAHGKQNCIISISANKSDCILQEQVDPATAKAYSADNQASFFLTSAKENSNIRELFIDVIYRKFPEIKGELIFREQVSTKSIEEVSSTNGIKIQSNSSSRKMKKKKCC